VATRQATVSGATRYGWARRSTASPSRWWGRGAGTRPALYSCEAKSATAEVPRSPRVKRR
jgi:hypothetical protein